MLMKSNVHNLKKSTSSQSSSRLSSSHPSSAESTSPRGPVLPNLDVSLPRTQNGGNMRHDRYRVPVVAHLPERRRIRGVRNPLENTSGGRVPGREEQSTKRGDARTAPRGGARNNANAKRSGRPTGRREPNARRARVPNAGRSEPWPHRWRHSAGELSTASAQHSKNPHVRLCSGDQWRCLSRRFIQAAKHPLDPEGKVVTRAVPQDHRDRCGLVRLSF
jgi:hypothetical protein